MEKVHKSESRPWISSRINLREFRDNWFASSLPSDSTNTKQLFQLSAREYSEIENECGLAAMECPLQHSVEISKEMIIPEEIKLETLKFQKEDLERRHSDAHYESMVYQNSRYYNYPPHKIAGNDVEVPDDLPFEPVEEPEILLCVQVFRPEKRTEKHYRHMAQRIPVFQIDQEFMVLGSQLLTDLRDKIECVSDQSIPGDYSEFPEHPPEITCKDLYKSGFFYFDGVFYNDMRHQDCRDYSEVIMNWAEKRKQDIGPFHKALMEDTKFIDLNLQLGYPYVYVHQGYCEHLIVFSDLLMHSHHHPSNRNEYPLYVAVKPKKRTLCMICHHTTAEWIVYDNKLLPENPFFFCKQCFFSFNYDENNKKVCDFKAYHHVDRSGIL